MNTKNPQKRFIIFFIIFIVLLFLSSVIFSLININNPNILDGITINNIDVSGLSKNQAIAKITDLYNKKKNNSFSFSYSGDKQISESFDYLGINYDIPNAVNNAFNLGRSNNIFKNNYDIIKLFFSKKNINLNFTINNDNLNSLIKRINLELPNRLIQSEYYIDENNLIIIKGSAGKGVNFDNLALLLNQNLSDLYLTDNNIKVPISDYSPDPIDIEKIYENVTVNTRNAYYEKNPLKIYPDITGVSFDKELAKTILSEEKSEYEIPLTFTTPEITIKDLDINIFKDTLSSFTTKYNVSNTARSTNLKLAASKINGKIISPGEEFSYNKSVGARTISAGYQEAKIYSNGEVVDGIGGGICQISSTLYNSCVLANLNIIERHNHQFLTSYVSAGRDATVSYGAKDFKFKNTRSYPIKIDLSVENGIVKCSILGLKEEKEYNIDFNVETISITDPPIKYEEDSSLSYGVEKVTVNGSKGMSVKVYKITSLDGKIISKDVLSEDTYMPLEKIILKNSET